MLCITECPRGRIEENASSGKVAVGGRGYVRHEGVLLREYYRSGASNLDRYAVNWGGQIARYPAVSFVRSPGMFLCFPAFLERGFFKRNMIQL